MLPIQNHLYYYLFFFIFLIKVKKYYLKDKRERDVGEKFNSEDLAINGKK